MIEIDDATGFPKLPTGYFWRVKKVVSPFAEVQIVKKGWLFPRVVESTTVYRFEVTPARIRDSARFIMFYRNPFKEVGNETLYGNYPPKMLK